MYRNISEAVYSVNVSKPFPTVNPSKHICSFNFSAPIRSVNSCKPVRPVDLSNRMCTVDGLRLVCPVNFSRPVRPVDALKSVRSVNFNKIVRRFIPNKPGRPIDSSTHVRHVNSCNFVLPVNIRNADFNKPFHPVNSSKSVRPADVRKPIPPGNSNKILRAVIDLHLYLKMSLFHSCSIKSFKYFVRQNQLPGFYIGGTFIESGLIFVNLSLWTIEDMLVCF